MFTDRQKTLREKEKMLVTDGLKSPGLRGKQLNLTI